MRTPAIALALAALTLSSAALAVEPVTGRWITEDGKAIVTIGHCGKTLCGKISKILAPTPDGPPVDENNSDPAKRHRPILGLTVLSGFTQDGDAWKGHVYSPEEGKTYRSTIERESAGTLKVKGCVAIFCKTQKWKRAG